MLNAVSSQFYFYLSVAVYPAIEKKWEGNALAFSVENIPGGANHFSDKSLHLEYRTEHLQLNNKKANNPVFTQAKDLKGHFSREDIQVPNKPMKRCSMTSAIREMPFTATVRSHFISSRAARSKRTDRDKDVEENIKWGNGLGNRSGNCSNG